MTRPARAHTSRRYRSASSQAQRLSRGGSSSESVQLCVGIGEVTHLAHDTLCLLSDHREAGWLRVETAGTEPHELESHRSEQLTTVVEFLLRFLFLARDIHQRTPLPAKKRETPYPFFASSKIQWV